MAKKQSFKFYAVRKGWKTGVFDRWYDGANEATEGFPKAVFKGFYSRREAEEWLKGTHEKYDQLVDRLLKGDMSAVKAAEQAAKQLNPAPWD